MDPQNYDAYGGLDHAQYCFQVSTFELYMYILFVSYGYTLLVDVAMTWGQSDLRSSDLICMNLI